MFSNLSNVLWAQAAVQELEGKKDLLIILFIYLYLLYVNVISQHEHLKAFSILPGLNIWGRNAEAFI